MHGKIFVSSFVECGEGWKRGSEGRIDVESKEWTGYKK
jgi:hypothetical protein